MQALVANERQWGYKRFILADLLYAGTRCKRAPVGFGIESKTKQDKIAIRFLLILLS